MEHRWGERLKVEIPVRITGHPFSVRAGKMSDLSVSGASIDVNCDVRVLARIEIALDPTAPRAA